MKSLRIVQWGEKYFSRNAWVKYLSRASVLRNTRIHVASSWREDEACSRWKHNETRANEVQRWRTTLAGEGARRWGNTQRERMAKARGSRAFDVFTYKIDGVLEVVPRQWEGWNGRTKSYKVLRSHRSPYSIIILGLGPVPSALEPPFRLAI